MSCAHFTENLEGCCAQGVNYLQLAGGRVFTLVYRLPCLDLQNMLADLKEGHPVHPALIVEALEEVLQARAVASSVLAQPIESAPKDGTRILLHYTHNGQHLCIGGQWNPDKYAKKPRAYWQNDWERTLGVTDCRANPPTHWQPLPSPPVKEQGK